MPNASDITAAPEATQACLSSGWLATAACHGRSIQRWLDRATAPKPRTRSSRPYRPPTWE
ncbi:hypothetical protein V7S57_22925 [Caulobacter sp. CCNWLY153]|jgi:hypothetical protein|uniref:hypothetical protein n=1 Tax=Caulobacter TaxID=75 RepID=UPI001057653B|nr:hypothetical protein [Caulobacter radicis]